MMKKQTTDKQPEDMKTGDSDTKDASLNKDSPPEVINTDSVQNPPPAQDEPAKPDPSLSPSKDGSPDSSPAKPEPEELSKKDLTGKEDDASELKIDVDDTNDYCNTCFKNGKKVQINKDQANCPNCGGELQWGQ